ncbi:hypothetical protein ACH4VR_29595 [Streptomyces sp. NPDC020883]|uniref:hypothetical protein n=1 Tax=Streptomyces sp. NPDC020883 TaxID=3365099 RepID=UPI003789D7C3
MSRSYWQCLTNRKQAGDEVIAQFEDPQMSRQDVIDAVRAQLHQSARQLVEQGAADRHGVFIDIVKHRPGVYLHTYPSHDSQK